LNPISLFANRILAMPYYRTPVGITPPAPGLDHEEPDMQVHEDDIPTGEGNASAHAEQAAVREEPVLRPERQ
jgi:hypothetical protein